MDNLNLLKNMDDNSVDLIYCDILYATGRNFRKYQDLMCNRKVVEEYYIPRITAMRRVLKDTGSIYLQMDTRINHWIRVIMDDIFGYDNFRNEVVWCYGAGGSSKKVPFAKKHDVILLYSKNNYYFFNILKNKDVTRIKDYWLIQSIADKSGYLQHDDEYRLYPTQKPKALLELIIKASSNEGDLIADFYCGSGTTCVVAKELCRKYIGCDISKEAVEISNNRLNDTEVIREFTPRKLW